MLEDLYISHTECTNYSDSRMNNTVSNTYWQFLFFVIIIKLMYSSRVSLIS